MTQVGISRFSGASMPVRFGNNNGRPPIDESRMLATKPPLTQHLVEEARTFAAITGASQVQPTHLLYVVLGEFLNNIGDVLASPNPGGSDDVKQLREVFTALGLEGGPGNAQEAAAAIHDAMLMLEAVITAPEGTPEKELSQVRLRPELARLIEATDEPAALFSLIRQAGNNIRDLSDDFKTTSKSLAGLEEKLSDMPPRRESGIFVPSKGSLPVLARQQLMDPVELLMRIRQKNRIMEPIIGTASKIAAIGGESQAGIEHVVMTLITLAEVAFENPELIEDDISSIPPDFIFHRIAADTLVPPEKRDGLSNRQILKMLGKAKSELATYVYRNGQQAQESFQPNFNLNTDLRFVLGNLLGGPPNRSVTLGDFLDTLHQQYANTPDQFSKGSANAVKTLDAFSEALANPEAVTAEAEMDDPETAEDFMEILEAKKDKMTPETYNQIKKQIKKFEKADKTEEAKHWNRLNFILTELDWEYKPIDIDLGEVRQLLDREYTGREDLKEKMMEFFAVLKRRQETGEPPSGYIFLMDGAPGIGKTKFAEVIAKATGLDFQQVSLGGVDDPTEIHGHNFTYVGSQPGRIARGIAKSGSMNPVLLLDEVDKMDKGHKGDPYATLHDVLDPEHNHRFTDHYLDIPLDLSQTIFVGTSNDLSKMPQSIRDRMEVIRLDGYDTEQKIAIAENHLVEKARKKVSKKMGADEFGMDRDAIRALIEDYTSEAGVRGLERKIQTLALKVNAARMQGKEAGSVIHAEDLEEYLGISDVRKPELEAPDVGAVNGLYVRGDRSGGGVAVFEASLIPSEELKDPEQTGKITLKNPYHNLSNLSQDSLTRAFDWLMSTRNTKYPVERPKGQNQEVVVSTEKLIDLDGDSAGAAKALAMISLLTGRPVRHDVAMTGTITLRGKVHAIGGVDKKLEGAMQWGMNVVFIPKQNETDYIKDVSDRAKEKMQLMSIDQFNDPSFPKDPDKMAVVTVDRIEDILDYALLPQSEEAVDNSQGGAADTDVQAAADNQPGRLRRLFRRKPRSEADDKPKLRLIG